MNRNGKWQRVLCLVALLMAGMPVCAAGEGKLTGVPMGSPNVDYSTGVSSGKVNTVACAFDGNPGTYYASLERSNTWVGLDLGSPHVITRVGWMPRVGQPGRVRLGLFEGANKPDFTDAVPLYLIPDAGTARKYSYAGVSVSRGFRYVRYVGPNDARCNVAEVEFYGTEGAGDDSRFYQITDIPTLSIHTDAGTDPKDKVNEMPSHMALTYDGGTRIQEYPMLIRGRGNASWDFPKKPYRIKFNDGKSHHMLKGSPLESPAKAKKWTLINNYGDKTLMRNCVAFELSRRLGLAYTPYCQPVDVILNGEYKGCYQLCDQITVDKNRVNITEMEPEDSEGDALTGGYLVEVDAYAGQETSWFSSSHGIPVTIKSPSDDDITTRQKAYIKRAFNLLERALWSSSFQNDSTGYRSKMDVESFLRHFIVGELAGNTDTYWSTYMYKNRNQTPFYVGPVWDFDLAMDNDSRIYPVNNRANWIFRTGGSAASGMTAFVSRALQDSYTDRRLKEIWASMRRSGKFTGESLVAYVDSMAQVLDASQRLNFTRWPILNTRVHQNPKAYGSYDGEVNVLREFLPARIKWIDDFLGYGHEKVYVDSVFYVRTPEDLLEFATAVNSGANGSEAYLTRDIDMAGYSDRFSPIGSGRHPFVGVFDGRGHSISNLRVSGKDTCGVFGAVSGRARIRDFVLDASCSISGGSYVGLVGASVEGGAVTIERVGNEAPVTGTGKNVAGIIGCNMNSACRYTIRDCYNTGIITGARESAAISGWLGAGAEVAGCWNTGAVTGSDQGRDMARYSGQTDFPHCYSTLGTQFVQVSPAAVASGELCYRLNEPKGANVLWYQKLGEDTHPVFGAERGRVVRNPDGTFANEQVLLGDVQQDDTLTLTDADWEAEHIVWRTPDGFYLPNADANSDGGVDVLDVVAIVHGTGGSSVKFETAERANTRMYSSNASVKRAGTRKVNVWLASSQHVTACQADLILSEGLAVDTASVSAGNMGSDTHVLKRGARGDTVRVVAYSTTNAPMSMLNGTLLTFVLRGNESFSGGSFTLARQVMTTADGKVCRPADASYTVSMARTYVSEIVMAETEVGMLVDDVHRLGSTVLPATATTPALAWKSSNEAVATVDSHGTVTARSLGTATITAQATDGSGVKATTRVDVVDGTGVIPIDGIPATAEIYTLTGTRVPRPSRGGIYIINGAKFLVK